MKNEIWKPIINYENLYEISNFGRIRTKEKLSKQKKKPKLVIPSKYLKARYTRCGYIEAALSKDKNVKYILIHRLVAITFIENPLNLPEVNHKDGDKLNNNVYNLEWVTKSQNVIHAEKLGLRGDNKGVKNAMSKLSEKEVFEIFTNNSLKNKDL